MRKILPYLFLLVFISAAYYIFKTATSIFKPKTKTEENALSAQIAYFKAHSKIIGKPFYVDSVNYNFQNFIYVPKKGTMVLIVDMEINNTTNYSKKYTASFFSLVGEGNKVYYPTFKPFTVFGNKKQKLKLIYYLPQRIQSSVISDIRINSVNDSSQNSFVRFYKSYRSEG